MENGAMRRHNSRKPSIVREEYLLKIGKCWGMSFLEIGMAF